MLEQGCSPIFPEEPQASDSVKRGLRLFLQASDIRRQRGPRAGTKKVDIDNTAKPRRSLTICAHLLQDVCHSPRRVVLADTPSITPATRASRPSPQTREQPTRPHTSQRHLLTCSHTNILLGLRLGNFYFQQAGSHPGCGSQDGRCTPSWQPVLWRQLGKRGKLEVQVFRV